MQRAHLVTRKRLAVEDGDAADLAQPVLYGQHVHGEGEGGARGKGWNRDFSQTKRDDRRFRVAGQQHAAALYSACASILDGQNQVERLLDENGCCVGGSSRHINGSERSLLELLHVHLRVQAACLAHALRAR